MKKIMVLALCAAMAGLLAVNGTYALPDVPAFFANLVGVLGETLGLPEYGGSVVDVKIVSGEPTGTIYPGAQASQLHNVKNQGTADVYFRYAVAVQYIPETWDKLDIQFDSVGYAVSQGWMDVMITGSPYKMKVFTYQTVLADGDISSPVEMTVGMDDTMTMAEMNRYGSQFIQMKVLAIDVSAFKEYDAEAALALALPLEDGFNPF